MSKYLLAISYEYYPELTPTAIYCRKVLDMLARRGWEIDLVTAATNQKPEGSELHRVFQVPLEPQTLFRKLIGKLRLRALQDIVDFPDDKVLWVAPCLNQVRQLIKERRPDAILIFVMPYSSGFTGIALRKETGIPVIVNFVDSPTCTDMTPSFPTFFHYDRLRRFENDCADTLDKVVYVSEINMKNVQKRVATDKASRFSLIRMGADPQDYLSVPLEGPRNDFRILYAGGMNGWYRFYHNNRSFLRDMYRNLKTFGRYRLAAIDWSSSSPVYIGRAVQQLIEEDPSLKDRVRVDVIGNRYPESVVRQVLVNTGIENVVSVSGPISNRSIIQNCVNSDLLFVTLPARTDGTKGGRISCKTYEYLMTDRPILAAVPKGENWDYLADKPGVWLVEPTDVDGMRSVIQLLTARKFSGQQVRFDRSGLLDELSYEQKVSEFEIVLKSVISQNI